MSNSMKMSRKEERQEHTIEPVYDSRSRILILGPKYVVRMVSAFLILSMSMQELSIVYFTFMDESARFENVGALSDPIFRYSLNFMVRADVYKRQNWCCYYSC